MLLMIPIIPELMLELLDDEEFAYDYDDYDQEHVKHRSQDRAEEYSLSEEIDDVWEDVTGDFFTTLFKDLDRHSY